MRLNLTPKHINRCYNIGDVLLHDKNVIHGAIKALEEFLNVDSKSEKVQWLKAQIEREEYAERST